MVGCMSWIRWTLIPFTHPRICIAVSPLIVIILAAHESGDLAFNSTITALWGKVDMKSTRGVLGHLFTHSLVRFAQLTQLKLRTTRFAHALHCAPLCSTTLIQSLAVSFPRIFSTNCMRQYPTISTHSAPPQILQIAFVPPPFHKRGDKLYATRFQTPLFESLVLFPSLTFQISMEKKRANAHRTIIFVAKLKYLAIHLG